MPAMPVFLCNLWNSSGFRYVGATLVGFLVAFGVEQVVSILERRRLRSAVREALAEEVADNLFALDAYLASFNKNLQRNDRHLVWPIARLRTTMLERCLDASVIIVLNKQEQSYASIAFYQLTSLADKMREDYAEIKDDFSVKDFRIQQLIQDLPVIAQNHVNLLVDVLAKQQVFASSRSSYLLSQLLPLLRENKLDSLRTWRTSQVPEEGRIGDYYISWTHDANDWPATTEIVELRPSEGSYHVLNDAKGHSWMAPLARLRGYWRKRKIGRHFGKFPAEFDPRILRSDNADEL